MPIQNVPPSSVTDLDSPISHFAKPIWGPFGIIKKNKLYCVIINEHHPETQDTLAVQFSVYKADYFWPSILIGQADTTNTIPPFCIFDERNNDAKILAGTAPILDSANPNWTELDDVITPRLTFQYLPLYPFHVAVDKNSIMYILYSEVIREGPQYNPKKVKIARINLSNETWLSEIEASPPWPEDLYIPDTDYPAYTWGKNFIVPVGNGKFFAIGQFTYEFVLNQFGNLKPYNRIQYCFYNGTDWGTITPVYTNSEEKDHLIVGTILDSNNLIHIFYTRSSSSPFFRELYHITLTKTGVLGVPQLLYTFRFDDGSIPRFPQPRLFTYEETEYIAFPFIRNFSFLNTISIIKLNTNTLEFIIENAAGTNLIIDTGPRGISTEQFQDFCIINGVQYVFWHERWTSYSTCGNITESGIKYATSTGTGDWSESTNLYFPGVPIVCMMVVAGSVDIVPESVAQVLPQYHHPM